MNATIEKIVNLLFEDVAQTEETNAIREEILQNCQDRYQDLREAGISDDDAIHAVIESQNGMEEMLSEYPRKCSEPAPEIPVQPNEETQDSDPRCWSCDPAQSPIQEIRMENMAGADVHVSVSQDHLVHVECCEPTLTLITGMENGVLSIALSEQKPEEMKEEIKFSLQEGFDLSGLGKMFEKLAKRFVALKDSLKGAEITLEIPAALCPALQIGTAGGDVIIHSVGLECLRIGTAGGDVELNAVQIQNELRVTTASGDVTVTDAAAQHMQISSASGDIEASGCRIQESVKLNTTSGDITLEGAAQTVSFHTVSGDLLLNGAADAISFHAVSGDVEINPDSQPGSISGNTTSGDVAVSLPEGVRANIICNTVSGDIYNHAGSIPDAPVTIKISTVSGDIEVN